MYDAGGHSMATLVRWEPFREFAALQNEMSRLVNSWGGEGTGNGGTRSWVPSVDVWETECDRFYRFERRFGSFERAIGLPQGVKEDQIKADYKDGVLEIRVPKPEQAKPRRIQIGGGDQATIEGSTAE